MLTEEQRIFLFTRWISSWPGGQMRELSIPYLVLLAWEESCGIFEVFSYPEFHITFWNTIALLTTSITALTVTQDNGTVMLTLKVFHCFELFSNLIGEQNVVAVTYWGCLQDIKRPLHHLFSFSSPLFSIWGKKKKAQDRRTVWHFFMLLLIFSCCHNINSGTAWSTGTQTYFPLPLFLTCHPVSYYIY